MGSAAGKNEPAQQADEGMPQFLSSLNKPSGNNQPPKDAAALIPLWKVKRKSVSQESIDNRTKHVVAAVAKAISKPSLLVRLEDLSQHLFQYPEAKSLAARV